MQGGRGGRDPSFDFGDPFASFGGFGGFGGHQSLLSSVFGGRGPFDDPFFSRPFGGGLFEPSIFGPMGNPFADLHASGFIEHQAPEPKKLRGPIIEELNSDDEREATNEEKKENPRKHGRKNKQLQFRNDFWMANDAQLQPQTRSITFQSSTVTYDGSNGAYYNSSRMRRTGSDGLTIEENKEADTTTRQASHRISRGLHNKGHSVTRKLNSDGKVDTMQTLHNLNKDELDGFEEAWNGNFRKHLPGWTGSFNGHDNTGASSSGWSGQASCGGFSLPSTECAQHSGRVTPDVRNTAGSSQAQHSGGMKTDVRNRSVHTQGRARN